MLHWAAIAALLYAVLAWVAVAELRYRIWRRRMLLIAAFELVFCVCLFVLLAAEMNAVKKNRLRADGRNVFDIGERQNIAQFLGDSWTRRWWPRISALNGFEWTESHEFTKRPLL
jgi:hypothetical protein